MVLLERPSKVDKRYEDKLLATTLTSMLQKEITEALAAGFVLVGMISHGERRHGETHSGNLQQVLF